MSDYSHKERPPIADIAAWLTDHHGAAVVEVAAVRGGYWSSAWSYRSDDMDLILRLGDSALGYQIDEAAESFRSVGVPVPEVLHIGEAFGKAAAISGRRFGSFVEEEDPLDSSRIGSALTGLLGAMRSVPARHVEWHREDGDSVDWRSWLAQGLSVETSMEQAWSSACAAHPQLGRTRDESEAAIADWLPSCPERRDLIHRDLLHQNVLIQDDLVTGIFSWKHSLFGDFLYDVAAFSLWSDWHPGIAAADIWNRVLSDTQSSDLVGAEQRHLMYQLHIGIEHLYWYVTTGNNTDLARLIGVMKPLLAQV